MTSGRSPANLRYTLKSKYNMTPEHRAELLSAQDGRCAICNTSDPGKRGWHIDHCHSTHRIRGLLCVKCNAGLGMFNDDAVLVEAAARYLERAALQRGFLPDVA